jgi:polyhydroxyalkanoate synthesis repressor PhaR
MTSNNELDIRVIKKYPNRRLYDTQISSYITLNDIKELVMSYVEFKVIDAKSKEDLTRCTLMQIIAEEETNGQPIMTADILKEFVRFYGDSMQAMMSRFLEHSIKLFMERRASLKSPLNTILGANPVSLMQNIAEENMDSWKEKNENIEETNTTPVI